MEVLGVRSGPARGLLVMCLSVVGVLAGAHLAHLIVGRPSDSAFHLGIERSFGEVFFMVLTVWTVALLAVAAGRLRSGVPIAWAAAFGYLFVDDWFGVHERVGGPIGQRLGTDFHVGELVWLVGLAVVLGSALLVLHLRSRGDARALSAVLFGLGLPLLFCGVVLDLAHGRNTSEAIEPWITLLEDGGEIAVMSVVVAFLFAVAYTGHRPRVGRRWGTLLGVPRELQRGFGS
jgi:hypothetical protein